MRPHQSRYDSAGQLHPLLCSAPDAEIHRKTHVNVGNRKTHCDKSLKKYITAGMMPLAKTWLPMQ